MRMGTLLAPLRSASSKGMCSPQRFRTRLAAARVSISPKAIVIVFFAAIIGLLFRGALTQRGSAFDKRQSDNGPRTTSGSMDGFAQGDPPAAFAKCAVCHSMQPALTHLGEEQRSGPTLNGIYGARSGDLAFNYSPALVKAFPVWDESKLNRFIANPQAEVPGNSMRFAGEPDPAKRQAIIAYLKLNSAAADNR